jgi:hypothetical protein
MMLSQKILIAKILSAAILLLIVLHLVISYRRAHPSSEELAAAKQITVGVSEEFLEKYFPMDKMIDSLLIHEYDIQGNWIKNEHIQLENLNYLRKSVQIPKYFPNTLFNLDVKNLADQNQWKMMGVTEKMTRQLGVSDFSMDIGKGNVIYERLDFEVSIKLRAFPKEVYFIISNYGVTEFDSLAKAFLELPEKISFHVPKEQNNGKLLAFEAERAGKATVKFIPWKYIYYFDDSNNEKEITERLYEILVNGPGRMYLIGHEKQPTYNVLQRELSRVVKKGYLIRLYKEKW